MTVTQTDIAALRANRIHNRLERRSGYPLGPLVCDCKVPDADPAVDFGMCQRCYRIPVALMHVKSEVPA